MSAILVDAGELKVDTQQALRFGFNLSPKKVQSSFQTSLVFNNPSWLATEGVLRSVLGVDEVESYVDPIEDTWLLKVSSVRVSPVGAKRYSAMFRIPRYKILTTEQIFRELNRIREAFYRGSRFNL